ncbi:uncharacterized protein PHACADRAFT_251386 [Phanerochaete carnosa HHB-10118-sp]|uniref:Zn(2)-C6 fungal-type domain-containing protein n=1 Tax=Phanerochaete carnosa (strain HHB-10118-sp) TaxID=650164 RepID=K5W1B5_PHACS|nr:uncharacterized protein PHACADRAFT_251386 [Phanerochaete carnosa HHB-10118-sp]EKM57648.1 hypothetical protein PHACADRAFT_251386 [Phanerochaete carnosa HHB-10118-sp]
MACTNCAAACKRCDDSRPCERCQKYGLADSCVDGQRKERKKGIKRGPYKRKAKPANGEGIPASPSAAGEGEASAVSAPYAAPPPPEAYYPYYYPHAAFAPPPHDGPSHGEGSTNGNTHPMHQTYFPLHPAVYPQYTPYAHAPPVPYAAPPAVISPPPADANTKSPRAGHESGAESVSKGKKKARAKTGESPAKGKTATNEANGTNGTNGTNGVEAHGNATNGFQTTAGQPSYDLPGAGSGNDGHMVPSV